MLLTVKISDKSCRYGQTPARYTAGLALRDGKAIQKVVLVKKCLDFQNTSL